MVADTRVKTVHFQPGPMAYMYTDNSVIDIRAISLEDAARYPEYVGSAQGAGIETAWYDGSNQEYVVENDPMVLKAKAEKVRLKLENEAIAYAKTVDEDGNPIGRRTIIATVKKQ